MLNVTKKALASKDMEQGEITPEHVLVSAEDAAQKTEEKRRQGRERSQRRRQREKEGVNVANVEITLHQVRTLLEMGLLESWLDRIYPDRVNAALQLWLDATLEETDE